MYSCPNDDSHEQFESYIKEICWGLGYWDADGCLEETQIEDSSAEPSSVVVCYDCRAEALVYGKPQEAQQATAIAPVLKTKKLLLTQ